MHEIINIPVKNHVPENYNYTFSQHMQYIYAQCIKTWRYVRRFENPQSVHQKRKHGPLNSLSEDDLRQKLILNLTMLLEGTDEGVMYTITAEDDESGNKPDIVLSIKKGNSKVAVIDIECKLVDSSKTLLDKYVNNGIVRFTSNSYDSSKFGIGGMIGFALNNEKHTLDKIITSLRDGSTHMRVNIVPEDWDGSNEFETEHTRAATHEHITIHHLVLEAGK